MKRMHRAELPTVLASLLNRHQEAASNYGEVVKFIEQEDLKKWFQELSTRRSDMYAELRDLAQDLPSIPSTPGRMGIDETTEYSDNWVKAINSNSIHEMIHLTVAGETDLSTLYRKSLSLDDIPDAIKKILEEQHKTVLDTIQRAEELDRAPDLEGS